MSYLEPPPMPAPVVVRKDVGGFVSDYRTQTEIYRATGREVRLHECRSACTLALSLPNVCVYPDSVIKFHQAYDPHSRQTDLGVSQQLFDSYPAAVRARLGGLTRSYKVLRGSELIALGVRNCLEPATTVAAAAASRKAPSARRSPAPRSVEPETFFAGLVQGVVSAFGSPSAPADPRRVAFASVAPKSFPAGVLPADVPLPPARPSGYYALDESRLTEAAVAAVAGAGSGSGVPPRDIPLPPTRPAPASGTPTAELRAAALPGIITGAQPILPPRFSALAALSR